MTAGRSLGALSGAAALLVLVGGSGADAADEAAGLIKYRQLLMQEAEAGMAAMDLYMKGQIDFKPAFAERAAAIAATARDFASLFPPGSDKGAKTNAKPDVWSNTMRFRGAVVRLTQESAKLAAVAKAGDEAGLKAQFQNVVDRCDGCHENFRLRM
ncbi:MAG: cytochrome c [Rhodospirillaceae bacterium]|nr:cytochrome c [Rhodospirillaceae bacterium]